MDYPSINHSHHHRDPSGPDCSTVQTPPSFISSSLDTSHPENISTCLHLKPIFPHTHTEQNTNIEPKPRRRISFCHKSPKIFESHCNKTYDRSSQTRKIDLDEFETIKDEILHYKMYEMKVHSKSHSNISLHDKILKTYQ